MNKQRLKQVIITYIHAINCKKISRFLLMAFLVTFPFQIRTLVFNMPYFPTGNFNEYTSFFIHFSDILLILAFCFFSITHVATKKTTLRGFPPLTICLLLFIIFLMGGIFVAEEKILHFFYIFRFLELLMLYFLLVNNVLNRKEILQFFLYGIIVQSFIALGQYLKQSSIGFGFLGEPNISTSIPGSAKVDIDGAKILRSYGTFPHPNVFAGSIIFAILWTCYTFRKKKAWFFLITIFLLMALILTFSRSAILAFIGGALVFFSLSEKKLGFKNTLFFGGVLVLLVLIFNLEGVIFERFLLGDDPQSGIERVQYIKSGIKMFFDYPFGIGMGHFTLHLQDYIYLKMDPWLIQPVHNVYLLALNEAGIFAGGLYVLLLGLLYYWLLRAAIVLKGDNRLFAHLLLAGLTIILIINLFDHYFFTLYQGQVMFFIYLGLVGRVLDNNKSLFPRKKS